jgi:hypothetical protein
LSRSVGAYDNSLLRSSVTRGSSWSINRGPASLASPADGLGTALPEIRSSQSTKVSSGGGLLDLGPMPQGGLSAPPTMQIGTIALPTGAAASVGQQSLASGANLFVSSIQFDKSSLQEGQDDIVSLVPAGQGVYSEYFAKGEQLLKNGDAQEALNQFGQANIIGPREPETWLSMMHAALAKADFSYNAASYYLQMAIKYFPELPLSPLKPSAFFAPDQYRQSLGTLTRHLRDQPDDVNALLILAYFSWFEGDGDKAAASLQKIIRSGRQANRDVAEAAQVFLDGMVASGRSLPENTSSGPAQQ